MKNNNVIESFFMSKPAKSSNKNLSTDGNSLYSYSLEIARRDTEGGYVIFDYTANGGEFASNTTSQHVGMTKRAAPSRVTTVMRPDAAKVAGLI